MKDSICYRALRANLMCGDTETTCPYLIQALKEAALNPETQINCEECDAVVETGPGFNCLVTVTFPNGMQSCEHSD